MFTFGVIRSVYLGEMYYTRNRMGVYYLYPKYTYINKSTILIILVMFSNKMRSYISNTRSVFCITVGLCIRYIHTNRLKS